MASKLRLCDSQCHASPLPLPFLADSALPSSPSQTSTFPQPTTVQLASTTIITPSPVEPSLTETVSVKRESSTSTGSSLSTSSQVQAGPSPLPSTTVSTACPLCEVTTPVPTATQTTTSVTVADSTASLTSTVTVMDSTVTTDSTTGTVTDINSIMTSDGTVARSTVMETTGSTTTDKSQSIGETIAMLPLWVWIIVAVGALILVTFCVIISTACLCARRKKKESPSPLSATSEQPQRRESASHLVDGPNGDTTQGESGISRWDSLRLSWSRRSSRRKVSTFKPHPEAERLGKVAAPNTRPKPKRLSREAKSSETHHGSEVYTNPSARELQPRTSVGQEPMMSPQSEASYSLGSHTSSQQLLLQNSEPTSPPSYSSLKHLARSQPGMGTGTWHNPEPNLAGQESWHNPVPNSRVLQPSNTQTELMPSAPLQSRKISEPCPTFQRPWQDPEPSAPPRQQWQNPEPNQSWIRQSLEPPSTFMQQYSAPNSPVPRQLQPSPVAEASRPHPTFQKVRQDHVANSTGQHYNPGYAYAASRSQPTLDSANGHYNPALEMKGQRVGSHERIVDPSHTQTFCNANFALEHPHWQTTM